ncbi:hypothetical protein GE09DRAFT_1228487 [Coniochaeta sp. 2T2.1]|nr:hypothetical protein GE09DRAFT_1228487 [Coniochaeta sp. 2T2.1]
MVFQTRKRKYQDDDGNALPQPPPPVVEPKPKKQKKEKSTPTHPSSCTCGSCPGYVPPPDAAHLDLDPAPITDTRDDLYRPEHASKIRRPHIKNTSRVVASNTMPTPSLTPSPKPMAGGGGGGGVTVTTEGGQEVTLKPGRKWEVFFGREIPPSASSHASSGGEVTDAQLAHFLDTEVTARFPQGVTYAGATGQWMRMNNSEGGGEVIKEGTTVVFLVEFDGEGGKVEEFRRLVVDAARAYKGMFGQDAVLVCEVGCLMEFV